MPKIPQYIAQQGIKTGPVADQINVGAMTAPAAAIGSFAGAAQDVGAFFQSREKEKELRWSGDAEYKFTNAMTEWHMANKDRDDYGPAFKEYSEKVASDFVAAAPSKRAGEVLKRQLQGSIARQYDMALRVGESNRLERFQVAETDATGSYLEMYRNMVAIDPVGSAPVLEQQYIGQIARINAALGDKAPATALKMRRQATLTVIEGMMDTDPDYAEMILNETKDIDETARQSLLNKIDSTRKQLRVLDASAFKMSVEDSLAQARRDGTYAVLPSRDAYDALMPTPEIAAREYESDRRQVEAYNGALKVTDGFKGKSSDAIRRDLEQARKQFTGQVGEQVDIEAAKQADKMIKMANDYPVEYLQNFNPTVSKMRELYAGATDQNRAALFAQLNAEILRYQGHAPAGAPDADYYLGLESHQVSLLTKEEAKKFAGQINNGTPTEKVNAIRSFEAMFANDPQARAIAFRDLTRLPEGERITQQAQTLAMHADAPYARQLAEALGKANENAKNKGLKIDDYESKLVTNKDWLAFASMYGGDNKQRSAVVAGFREAITAYAASLDVSNASEAVKISVETLIGNKFQFEDIGKQTVPFAKWAGPDERPRSDFEMSEAVKRVRETFMEPVLAHGLMQTTDDGSPLWPIAPNATQQAIDTYIQNDVNENKILVPSEDGKGMYVYLQTKQKIPVQLRTKDKRPLFISFDTASKRHNYPGLTSKTDRRYISIQDTRPTIESVPTRFVDDYGNTAQPTPLKQIGGFGQE